MTKAAPRTPTKGRVKQHLARRSLDGERGQALPSHVQEPESSGWSFSRKQFLTLTRHSNCRPRCFVDRSRCQFNSPCFVFIPPLFLTGDIR